MLVDENLDAIEIHEADRAAVLKRLQLLDRAR
jgi:hypothetical protein